MDQTLELKLEEFKQALKTLDEVLSKEHNDIIRDSVIKRFEYTFEIAWKTVKVFLRDKFGVKVSSPKEVFRNLTKNNLISAEDTQGLLEMVDNRNEIIHTYNLDFANELEDKIRNKYFDLMHKLFEIIADSYEELLTDAEIVEKANKLGEILQSKEEI